jgi:hypothetical protein
MYAVGSESIDPSLLNEKMMMILKKKKKLKVLEQMRDVCPVKSNNRNKRSVVNYPKRSTNSVGQSKK